ncbi:unnamed protein product, partial [marine sediment metagenome]
SLPRQTRDESLMVTLPSNAIPIGIEVRPLSMPEGLFLHYLIPCEESGNPIEEVTPSNIYETAWEKLSQLYGERSEQENLDVMDSVLKGVVLELENELGAKGEAEKEA